MLPGNIETEIAKIIQKKGKQGWMRTQECAKEYMKDPETKQLNDSRKTRFYRWRAKVEKRKVEGFQIVKLPGNVSFIGIDSADPRVIESTINRDGSFKRSIKSGFGFFEWLKWREEQKNRKLDELDIEGKILFQKAMMTREEREDYLKDPEKQKKLAEKCREAVEARRLKR